MSDEELKELDKEVKKLKRMANEQASVLHDLIEDRLPAAFEDLPAIAQSTYDACKNGAEANARLSAAQKGYASWPRSAVSPAAASNGRPSSFPSSIRKSALAVAAATRSVRAMCSIWWSAPRKWKPMTISTTTIR